MEMTNTLWNSPTHGHTVFGMLLACLAVLFPALVGTLFAAMQESETLMIVMICISAAAILATAAVVLAGRFTSLKWCRSNLLFMITESGFYFTGTVNRDSYFSTSWRELESYSVKPERNGLATVTIVFVSPADCGSFGTNKSLKMVGIENIATLEAALADKGIKKI